ncbi:MAG: adenosylhomocysteinase [Oscillospiraceae bacterium]|nr:adenosylhomocysteinase [Oscillospiraceae bacterium]
MSEIRDISLAEAGELKIQWAARHMPVLGAIEAEFKKAKPFRGLKIALSVHMEAKTAYLCRVLERGGAEMHATGCNPLSTQDDVAAALAAGGIDVYALHAATAEEYERHLRAVIEFGPDIIIDDGGDLVSLIHKKYPELIPGVLGGCEETTTGVRRLKAMDKAKTLKFPMIMVNDAKCKHLFDNRYGTGQSVWDGINRTTNLLVAGKYVVVSGYGWCGKGVSMRAKGMGAKVIVTEVDAVRALEAVMDGFEVMPMDEAARCGDIFITVTGCRDVLLKKHFKAMKDGAVIANAGHFNVETDLKALTDMAVDEYDARANIKGYELKDGRVLFVLAEGRLVNVAAGDGHPAEIMDMSFAIQALCAEYIAKNGKNLKPGLLSVPEETDAEVAERKLEAMGVAKDRLTAEQKKYLES